MLVYARCGEAGLSTTLCDRTAPLEKAAGDIKVLEGGLETKPEPDAG